MTFNKSTDLIHPPRNASSATRVWLRALQSANDIALHSERTLAQRIIERAADKPSSPALLSHDAEWSFETLARRISHYARWAIEADIGIGDVVAILMPNSPDFIAAWLGISSIGGVAALVNASLRGPSLAHSVKIANPKRIIVDASLLHEYDSARRLLSTTPDIWIHGEIHGEAIGGFRRVDASDSGDLRLPRVARKIALSDPALYIYTSGTTGMPKAAIVSHFRIVMWSCWFAGLLGIVADDRMYNCLPLYHSVGGVVAVGAPLVNGASVVLREKFSARDFWRDIDESGSTLFQYIGELCRYLVNAPQSAYESRHRLRACCGNGLREDVWPAFKDRFAIPNIFEFYASTEGVFSLYNVEQKPGAIGRIPAFSPMKSSISLIKLDSETNEPLRNKEGFCIACKVDEPGEAIGRVSQSAGQNGRFEGYTNLADGQKKLVHDVFEVGDSWFRTGDLMRRDAAGFFYFVDRLGDTFRWKGENVSTVQVEEIIGKFPDVVEAIVYGVNVPFSDGKAGMALLLNSRPVDLRKLQLWIDEKLPEFARPVFLRLNSKPEMTTTFKHKKSELAVHGFDPRRDDGDVYYFDPITKRYVPVTGDSWRLLMEGRIRL